VKLAVPFELRIFLVVMLVGIISVLVVLDTPLPEQQLSAAVVQGLQQPGEPSNTLIITGIDIGQTIGFKSPTISGNEFACFADKNVQTDRGRATIHYFLLLRDPTAGGFNGCRIEFAETEQRKTGLFMRCPSTEDMFSFIIDFDPSLDSDIVDNELEDILEETIPMFRAPYTVVKADVRTSDNRIMLRFIGPMGTLDIEDNYADTAFSDGVKVNGKHVLEGRVRIRATATSDEFRIQRIEYRFRPLPTIGKDVFVADHQGTKQHLRTPEAFLGDFDLLFRGLGGTPPRVSTPKARYGGGNVIAFDAVGDDMYNMIFTNTRGQTYKFPLIARVGGVLKFGDDDQDFLFVGAGAGPPFNIDLRDMFAVTNRQDPQGITNIVEYSSVDVAAGNAYFKDLAGGQTIGHFDGTTGDGTVIIGGNTYNFRVDIAAPNSMTIDQNGDGTLGGEVEIVTAGGPRIDLSAGFSGALEIDARLFADEAPAGGETINFAFMLDGNDVDADVTSGVTLIKNDVNGMEEGLSQFGVFVQLDDRRTTARDLVFNMPGGQRAAVVTIPSGYSPGGQAQGEVLVTCERSEFVKRAQEAKAKKAGG